MSSELSQGRIYNIFEVSSWKVTKKQTIIVRKIRTPSVGNNYVMVHGTGVFP